MDFEIVGEITAIETFASGSGVRERARCAGSTGKADGVSARESHASVWLMALCAWPKFTGTKPTV